MSTVNLYTEPGLNSKLYFSAENEQGEKFYFNKVNGNGYFKPKDTKIDNEESEDETNENQINLERTVYNLIKDLPYSRDYSQKRDWEFESLESLKEILQKHFESKKPPQSREFLGKIEF